MTRVFSLPYELRLGVTGHRTIEDEPGVARAIASLLDRIDDTLKHRNAAPLKWTVVSPLARGADRLLARAVLERKGGRLEVVTPFPLTEYRQDFCAADDAAQFEQLLARAAQVNELDSLAPHENGEISERIDTDRDTAYQRVGEHVVDACEILVAVWNGREAGGVGGTADIVQYAVQHGRVVLWIHGERPHEPPRRMRAVTYSDDGNLVPKAYGDFPISVKDLSVGYHQQSKYCLDASIQPEHYARYIGERCSELVKAADTAGLPVGALDGACSHIVPHFVRADQLALHYQRRYGWAIGGVLYLAASGVTVAMAQVLFFPDQVWLIGFEILAMLMVFGVWRHSRREAWHEKWLHDRYLAERLRTVLFTTLAGTEPALARSSDPLPFYRGPQHWLVLSVGGLARSAAASLPALPLKALRELVIQTWILDQQRFHQKNAIGKARRAHVRHLLGLSLFGATLLMALLHLFGIGHASEANTASLRRVDLWVTFLALVLPVWAGTVHAVTSQLELERIAERSKRMARVLEGLANQAARAQTHEQLRVTCAEAAELMMMENYEWWVLLSFQDVRLHV